jgi:hypothetical protein
MTDDPNIMVMVDGLPIGELFGVFQNDDDLVEQPSVMSVS